MSLASIAFLALVILVFGGFTIGLFSVYLYVNLPTPKMRERLAAARARHQAGSTAASESSKGTGRVAGA